MAFSDLPAKVEQKTCISGDQEWISSWLRHAGDQDCDQGENEVGDTDVFEPVTPERRPHLLQYHDELSPTSTNFSGGSVFDTPNEQAPWIDDPFCDNGSEATSIDDQEWDPTDEPVQAQSTKVVQPSPGVGSGAGSVASYDPASETNEDLEKDLKILRVRADRVTPPVDPDRSRITWITSCTQRNGQAELCLLYRRKFREEIDRSDAESCTTLVLLRLKSETGDIWTEKLKLAEELDARWRTEEDRKNWVLPSIEGWRGDFRTHGMHVPRPRTGEGKGHFTYQELHVAVEDRSGVSL